VFVFVATYPDTEGAEADHDTVKDLPSAGVVGTYDAAVIDNDAEGKSHMHEHKKLFTHRVLK
jgi:hypothetical protein